VQTEKTIGVKEKRMVEHRKKKPIFIEKVIIKPNKKPLSSKVFTKDFSFYFSDKIYSF